MTDPKLFYRDMDALLATIYIEPAKGDLLPHVMEILESAFAATYICEKLFDDTFVFGNRTAWEDDATIVVIKRHSELKN
ncbi:hypothetical protein EH223_02970 [candidate division KSB1 bacterium]|nr:hypothetical protein [candidate division KSB1 bacterium]RQW06103.1 MAG: hypothetical protein EH223_02970 [candidate division KSB1 bacterium]